MKEEMQVQKIIITGGATRIGAAIAEGLANGKNQITIHYNKSIKRAKQLKNILEKKGSKIFLIKANLNNISELNRIIIANAIQGKSLKPKNKKKEVSGDGLFNIINDYIASSNLKNKISKQTSGSIGEAIASSPIISKGEISNSKKLELWVKSLQRRARKLAKENDSTVSIKLAQDEDGLPFIETTEATNGSKYAGKIPITFFRSSEYQAFKKYQEILKTFSGGATISDGETTTIYDNIFECLDELIATSKRGQTIQRYKGLGEMNPGQLWDTTLDPDNRTLLEVRLDDPDDPEVGLVFAELMGDEVAPRRQFIEENALNVLNIDV